MPEQPQPDEERRKEDILNAIVAYRLLNQYAITQDADVWKQFSNLSEDMEFGEFELLIGMSSLVTLLMLSLAYFSGRSVDDILNSISTSVMMDGFTEE